MRKANPQLNILKDHIFQFFGFFVQLKECPVVIQTFVFQIKCPLFISIYSDGNFSENVDL